MMWNERLDQTRLLTLDDSKTPYGRRLRLSLPEGCAGAWCRVQVRVGATSTWWAKLEVTDAARAQVVREIFLGPVRRAGRRPGGRQRRDALVHVPLQAGAATLHLFGPTEGQTEVLVAPVARPVAALHLLATSLPTAFRAVRGSASGRAGRVRAALGYAAWRHAEAPAYADWLAWFEPQIVDAWLAAEPGAPWIDVGILGGPAEAIARSRASVVDQAGLGVCLPIAAAADWRRTGAPWVALLQAGEVLAPYALAVARAAIAREPGAPFVYADVDALDAAGRRSTPQFKPESDPVLLRSGLLTRGMCLFPAPLVRRVAPSGHADPARLALALAAAEASAPPIRLPLVLTHRGPGVRAAPDGAMHGVVRRHLRERSVAAMVEPPEAAPPVRVRPVLSGQAPLVSILIPSACRGPHVRRSIERVARGTAYSRFEIILAVQSHSFADPVAMATLAALRRLPQLRVLDVGDGAFNYSRVNNIAAREARGELLLLLNDDVAPIGPDWLGTMVAHLQDRRVGAVGARLLYGNDSVQHAGIIMGMTNLCEHADRMAPRDHAGPQGLARVDRCVSAVTAACLLTRAATWRALGGLDEGFAIALNDVDFCLRLGRTGARIVYASGVELHHYESLSLGRHYAGDRANLEGLEVRRLRERWSAVIDNDPFYSPNASLQSGREWQPAFPPRTKPPERIAYVAAGLVVNG